MRTERATKTGAPRRGVRIGEKKLTAPVVLFAAIEAEQHEALRAIAFSERRSLADVVRKAVAARPKASGHAMASPQSVPRRLTAGGRDSNRPEIRQAFPFRGPCVANLIPMTTAAIHAIIAESHVVPLPRRERRPRLRFLHKASVHLLHRLHPRCPGRRAQPPDPVGGQEDDPPETLPQRPAGAQGRPHFARGQEALLQAGRRCPVRHLRDDAEQAAGVR